MPSTLKLSQRETAFNNEVVTRFELYNSLFQTLPFYQVKDTGILLPFFSSHCEKEATKQVSPTAIIESFFKKYVPDIDHREQNGSIEVEIPSVALHEVIAIDLGIV